MIESSNLWPVCVRPAVRVSLAESADAFRAIEQMGIDDRNVFKTTLQTTLIKDSADVPEFKQTLSALLWQRRPSHAGSQRGIETGRDGAAQASSARSFWATTASCSN